MRVQVPPPAPRLDTGLWKVEGGKSGCALRIPFYPLSILYSLFIWRPRPELNRGMAVLQTAALTTWLRGREV